MDSLKKKMVKLLCDTPLGRSIACNIIDALSEGLVQPVLVREYLQECLVSYSDDASCLTSESLAALFRRVGYGQHRKGHLGFLFCCCTHTGAIEPNVSVSTVMPYRVFAGLVDRGDWNKRFSYRSPHNADCGHPALRRLFANPNNFNGTYALQKSAYLGRIDELFWITISSRIKSIIKNLPFDKRGDRVRDRLGLIHHGEQVPLVELRLKSDKITDGNHARPTFAEAGDHRRFKIKTDLSKNRKMADWGFNADLLSLEKDRPSLDGMPEQVVKPISTDELKRLCKNPIT